VNYDIWLAGPRCASELRAGLFTALLGVAAQNAMDYRLGRRQMEPDERAAITAALGNGPGLLRRATVRLRDRAHGCFRDAPRGQK
jgi:hypothetical protein